MKWIPRSYSSESSNYGENPVLFTGENGKSPWESGSSSLLSARRYVITTIKLLLISGAFSFFSFCCVSSVGYLANGSKLATNNKTTLELFLILFLVCLAQREHRNLWNLTYVATAVMTACHPHIPWGLLEFRNHEHRVNWPSSNCNHSGMPTRNITIRMT